MFQFAAQMKGNVRKLPAEAIECGRYAHASGPHDPNAPTPATAPDDWLRSLPCIAGPSWPFLNRRDCSTRCSQRLLRGSLQLLLKPVFFTTLFDRLSSAAGCVRCRTARRCRRVSRSNRTRSAVWAGEWCRSMRAPSSPPGVVLYLHGGAFCIGSPATHRALTARLARITGLPVFSLDYRLAPEHPYPAGLDDAIAAFRELSAEGAGPPRHPRR